MKRVLTLFFVTAGLDASAHFQTLLPSSDIIRPGDNADVMIDIRFTHPMEQGPLMNMGEPTSFAVVRGGESVSLAESLKSRTQDDVTYYEATYTVDRPGDLVFSLEPAPYWEPAEGKMIIHYTKVVVNAYGEEDGWDTLTGAPVEIEPLVRPYGLWTGNLFRGRVLKDGNPVPFAEVEVEFWNKDGIEPPADPFITQVIKADAGGVFAYAMPRAGWWGFAALVDGDEPMPNPDGEDVGVELGGLIWIRCVDMK